MVKKTSKGSDDEAEKREKPPPPEKPLPHRKPIHRLTRANQPTNQGSITDYFGSGRKRHKKPSTITFRDFLPKQVETIVSTDDQKKPSPSAAAKTDSSTSSNIVIDLVSDDDQNQPTTSGHQPLHYGSEWDTDGEPSIQQRESLLTTHQVNQTPNVPRKVAAANKRKRTIPVSESSDSDFENRTDGPAGKKPAPKRKKPAGITPTCYQATVRSTDVEMTFLGNKFKKQEKRFECPFEDCGAHFSAFSSLKNHFQKQHGLNGLQKPIDFDTNNWRRIQNANSRYDISTVKLKLRSLLVDGESLGDDRNKKQRQQVNNQILAVLNNKSIELSKLAILFTSLAYYKIYNVIRTSEDADELDDVFRKEVDWQLILLKFKSFKRNTANSGMSNATAKRTPKSLGAASVPKPPFHNIDDDVSFNLCKKYNIDTNFEEWSQKAWHCIADTFRTNFETNITTHLYNRVRNWFRFMLRNGKKNKDVRGKANRKVIGDHVYHTMTFLFDPDKSTQPEKENFIWDRFN